ncbi:MAG: hypothetical protein J6U28_08675 [Bacteroidales bacterium]|nr:hypothetical protein [Bacteroidales bacterium]
MSYYRSSSNDVPLSAYFIALAVLLLFSCIPGCVKVTDEHWETVTVTNKDIKNKSKDSKYLIWADKVKPCDYCGEPTSTVYEITDSLFMGRFDSSDLYGAIEVGHTYEIRIAGQRWPLMSWYQNIYEVKEVEE